jgi:hypothetical protein
MAIKITTGQNMAVMELPLEIETGCVLGPEVGYVGLSQTLRGE